MTQETAVGSTSHDVPRCERCGSTRVQTLSLVHQLGTATLALSSETVGLGFGASGDAGVGGAVTRSHGMTQTVLSARVAPPSPATERWGGTATIAIITAIFALIARSDLPWFGNLLLITGGLFTGWVAFREYRRVVEYNLTEYPKLLKQWRASALCLVCGHTQRLLLESQL